MGLKLNPFTGKFDLVSIEPENFSYNNIVTGKTVTVPENQLMLVHGDLDIDGVLELEGEVLVFDLDPINRVIDTSTTETINASLYELIRQTSSGITTSLGGIVEGTEISIVNSSAGTNTLNITVQGVVNPVIYSRESFSLIFNGVDWDIV